MFSHHCTTDKGAEEQAQSWWFAAAVWGLQFEVSAQKQAWIFKKEVQKSSLLIPGSLNTMFKYVHKHDSWSSILKYKQKQGDLKSLGG